MKYIITESKFNKLVSSYLDSQDWRTLDIGNGEFDVAEGEHGKNLLRFRIRWSITMPDLSFDILYIDDSLVWKIKNVFGITKEQSVSSIINWFNERFDYNLTMDDYESTSNNEAWDEDYYDEDDY